MFGKTIKWSPERPVSTGQTTRTGSDIHAIVINVSRNKPVTGYTTQQRQIKIPIDIEHDRIPTASDPAVSFTEG